MRSNRRQIANGFSIATALTVLVSVCLLQVPATSKTLVAQGTPTEVAPAADAKEPTLDEVVGKALTAYGGKDALAKLINNATFFGKQLQPGGASQAYRHLRKGTRWRTDVESNSADIPSGNAQTETSAFDGTSGWTADGGVVLDMSGDRLGFLNEQEERQPWLLSYWKEPDYTFELKGRTSYRQIPVYAIDVIAKDGRTTTMYLDQHNYLVVALSYQTEIPEKETAARGAPKIATITVDYSEYRPTNGTMVPFKTVRAVNNSEVETIELATASAGKEIEDSQFYRPSAGSAWHIPKSVTIPFDYSDKEIVIKGRLNGSEELEFLLDTGASETIIDRRVAAEHFLAKGGQYNIAGIAGYVATESSVIKRMEIGNLILNDVQARILDLSSQSRAMGKRVAGIIGTNVISKFVTAIDYSKPSITIGDIDNYQRPAKAAAVPFVNKQAPFVKVLVNGRDEQILLVDTGAAFNHLPGAVATRYVGNDPTNLRHVTQGTGLDGRPLQLGKVTIDTVAIGGLPLRKVPFTYPITPETTKATKANTLPKERGGFYADNSLGILGNPFWENFIVTIDYKYQRLLLSPNPVMKLRDDIGQMLAAGDNQLVLHRDFRLAELNYQKALMTADRANDQRDQAILLGRLGNLRRMMAKDLQRPEHSSAAYDYFRRAQELASKLHAQDVEGRILADWSLLYSDSNQAQSAKATMDRGLMLAPQDPNVNVDCAVHLYRARLYPEMQKYVEKALFLEPSNWQALWYQVKLSENFYDTPRVVATLKEILRFYPWSKVAANKLRSLNMSVPADPSEGGGAPKASAPAAAVPKTKNQ